MKFYSEKIKKFYDTAEECKAAEKKYLKELEEEEKAKQKRSEERKVRAAEVEAARNAVVEAKKHYNELLEAFCKDYGSYHYTVSDPNSLSSFFFDFLS